MGIRSATPDSVLLSSTALAPSSKPRPQSGVAKARAQAMIATRAAARIEAEASPESAEVLRSRLMVLTAQVKAAAQTLNAASSARGVAAAQDEYEALCVQRDDIERMLAEDAQEKVDFVRGNKLTALADVCGALSDQLAACEANNDVVRTVLLPSPKTRVMGASLTEGAQGPLTPGGTHASQKQWPCGFAGSVDVHVDLGRCFAGASGGPSIVVPGRSGTLAEARAVAARRRRASWGGCESPKESRMRDLVVDVGAGAGEEERAVVEEVTTPSAHRRSRSEGEDEFPEALLHAGAVARRAKAVVAFGAALTSPKLPEQA